MLRINYPTVGVNLLHDEYLSVFRINLQVLDRYSRIRSLLPNPNVIPADLCELLIAPFEQLVQYNAAFNIEAARVVKLMRNFMDYDKFDNRIAKFFMNNQNRIKLATCYYCNIDNINAFEDIDDFRNWLDLIKRGTENDLMKIDKIGAVNARLLHVNRHNINNINDLNRTELHQDIRDNLVNFIVKRQYSHFTLDHVLHKAANPLIAISLYNFVPSCYSCNTKFKSIQCFVNNHTQAHLSPTHPNFIFNEQVKFKLFFNLEPMSITDITQVTDFILYFDFTIGDYRYYVEVLKLKGRYKFYKKEALDLIERKKEYDDTQIREISGLLGKPEHSIRSVIFGKQIFEGELEDKPLTKMKRDIYNQILAL